jgi:hypothetical protein
MEIPEALQSLKDRMHVLLRTPSPQPLPSPGTPPTPSPIKRSRNKHQDNRHSTRRLLDRTPMYRSLKMITKAHALQIISEELANWSTTNATGCWLSTKAANHRCGYRVYNLRKTRSWRPHGSLIALQPFMHQIALIAAGKRKEMRGIGKTGATDHASHLCHNSACFNPRHVVVESAKLNKWRNSCRGHKIIYSGRVVWHPCVHGMVESYKRCILPKLRLRGAGYYVNTGFHKNLI